MKLTGKVSIILLLLVLAAGTNFSCKPAPPCGTSLVTLDETRLDAQTFEKEEAETGKSVDELQGKLTAKEQEITKIKDDPARLQKKLHELKKGSGRDD
ncbi:MAG: hypothetical protein JW814_05780 [Candidatus Krumholzibacteriota bacterium]|nr:hypothetical protein [Candidatus Krumholzibacteriota bacterium]